MTYYDLIIIGGGPGGYVAASHAANHGLKTALVEASFLGGTCLNTGCIPSKTYLKAASMIANIKKAKDWGIETNEPIISFKSIKEKKDTIVSQLRNGVGFLMKQGKIDVFKGLGKIQQGEKNEVVVTLEQEEKKIQGKHILIATGSNPIVPNIEGIHLDGIYTTDTIFELEQLPNHIVIVGGGVIGVEFATIFSEMGSRVTLVEAAPRLLMAEDEDATKVLTKQLKKQGISIKTEAMVQKFTQHNDVIQAQYTIDGKAEQVDADAVLVCIGRKPNHSASESLDLKLQGPFIQVNEFFETSKQNILAIGDVIGGYQLAHVASAEGIAAVDHIAGKSILMDRTRVPRCIYTTPEIASVGYTEQELQKKGMAYKVEKYNHTASGKALVLGETEGFTKVMYDEKYGEVLGVVVVGPNATEMISESTAFMSLEGTMTELANIIHPHPTLSEGLFEAALHVSHTLK